MTKRWPSDSESPPTIFRATGAEQEERGEKTEGGKEGKQWRKGGKKGSDRKAEIRMRRKGKIGHG